MRVCFALQPGHCYPKHHAKQGPCYDRPPYRDGRRKTAVKAYCISDESKYLQIYGVPAIGLTDHLTSTAGRYGRVEWVSRLNPNPSATVTAEAFTDTFAVKFANINCARHAKRRMDDMNFFGGSLHVVYAPEMESVEECRLKLKHRCQQVTSRLTIKVAHMAREDGNSARLVPDAQCRQDSNYESGFEHSSHHSSATNPKRVDSASTAKHDSPSNDHQHPAVLQARLAMSSQQFPTGSTASSLNEHRPTSLSTGHREQKRALKRTAGNPNGSAQLIGPSRPAPTKYYRRQGPAPTAIRSPALATPAVVPPAAAAAAAAAANLKTLLAMRPRQLVLIKRK